MPDRTDMISEIRSRLLSGGYVVETQGDLDANDQIAPACLRIRRPTGNTLVVVERSEDGVLIVVGTLRGIFGTSHYRRSASEAVALIEGAFAAAAS